MSKLKDYSPNGTYLVEHPKKKVWMKHWKATHKSEYPDVYKGAKCYVYKPLTEYDYLIYTASPKQKGSFIESFSIAKQLREMFMGI